MQQCRGEPDRAEQIDGDGLLRRAGVTGSEVLDALNPRVVDQTLSSGYLSDISMANRRMSAASPWSSDRNWMPGLAFATLPACPGGGRR